MRRGVFVDTILVISACIFSLYVRENFHVSDARLEAFVPYLLFTTITALIVIPLAKLDRAIWRFSSFPDYMRACVAAVAITFVTVALAFSYNRLDGVARSLPIIQVMASVFLMVGLRVVARLHWNRRSTAKRRQTPLRVEKSIPTRNVLIIGLNRLAETYLESVQEFGSTHIRVIGILGRKERHVRRLAAMTEVLGMPEDIEQLLQKQELHGQAIDEVVVAMPFGSLSPQAQKALMRIDQLGQVKLRFIGQNLGLVSEPSSVAKSDVLRAEKDDCVGEEPPPTHFILCPTDIHALGRRWFWSVKRCVDVIGALTLIVLCAPVMVVVAILVAIDIGFPVAFWQRRPGLGGRPFKLIKFRSMASAFAPNGRRRADEERTSRIGEFLRKSRLDELPQLFSILAGDMSFVGPRPLLPRDQAESYEARLLVRPGLTGWAQVIGGRTISAEDKAALDVWYVRNASLLLDIEIVLRTIPIVLIGERLDRSAVHRAWRDLEVAGVVRARLSQQRHNLVEAAE